MPHKPPFLPSQYVNSTCLADAIVVALRRSTAGSEKGNTLNGPPPVSLLDIAYREHLQVGIVWEMKKDALGWAESQDGTWPKASQTEPLGRKERLVEIRTAKDEHKHTFVLGKSMSSSKNVWFSRGDHAKRVNGHPQWGLRGDLTFTFCRHDGDTAADVVKQFKLLTVWERWKNGPKTWTKGMMTLGPGVFAGYVKAMGSHSDDHERKKFPSIWVIWQWNEQTQEWQEGVYRVKNPQARKRVKGVFLHPGYAPSYFLGCLSPGTTESEWGFESPEDPRAAMWGILNDVGVQFADFKPYPSKRDAKWFLIRVTDPLKVTSLPVGVEKTVTAIESPKPFRLCAPATFKAKYVGHPTEDEKQGLMWVVKDASTSEVLTNAPGVRTNGETLEIDCVPIDWHDRSLQIGAQFRYQSLDPQFSGKADSCDLYAWIATIQKAEREYPGLSGVEMANAMRRLAGYDDDKFRKLYGGSPRGAALAPTGGLAQADLDLLIRWTRHRLTGGKETGIALDPLGRNVACGHVLTGLSAGVYRDRNVDITPGYSLWLGEKVDNLYAATIAGDLGQAAVFVNAGKQSLPYIGQHGDATEAELIGDIDGFLIGDREPRGGSGRKLSEILATYYCPCSAQGVRTRFASFKSVGMGALKDQVNRFGNTYVYASEGKVGGVFSDVDEECDDAADEFVGWLDQEVAKEQAGSIQPIP